MAGKGLAIGLAVVAGLAILAASSSASPAPRRRRRRASQNNDQGDAGNNDQGDAGNNDQGDAGNNDQGDAGNDDQGDAGNNDQGDAHNDQGDAGNNDQGDAHDDQGDAGNNDQGDANNDQGDANTDQGDVPPDEFGRPRTGDAARRYRAALTLETAAMDRADHTTPAERARVADEQRTLGIAADGVIGSETRGAIARQLVTAPPDTITDGTRDDYTNALAQRRAAYELRLLIAQSVGVTRSKVRELQRRMGMEASAVDGRIGPLTRGHMTQLLEAGPLDGSRPVIVWRERLYGTNGANAPQ